jgi:hypothetical protein
VFGFRACPDQDLMVTGYVVKIYEYVIILKGYRDLFEHTPTTSYDQPQGANHKVFIENSHYLYLPYLKAKFIFYSCETA